MAKERRLQIRVDDDLLAAFDRLVGRGKRSKAIIEYMEDIVLERKNPFLKKYKRIKRIADGTN